MQIHFFTILNTLTNIQAKDLTENEPGTLNTGKKYPRVVAPYNTWHRTLQNFQRIIRSSFNGQRFAPCGQGAGTEMTLGTQTSNFLIFAILMLQNESFF